MKRLLTLAVMMLCCISLNAQTQNPLIGTWKIESFQYGENPNNNEQNYRFKKYKSFSPTHFTVIEVDSASGVTTTSIFGAYKFDNGMYVEKILHVNRESAGMIGQIFKFTVTMEGDNKMRSVGSFNGMKTAEVWARIPGEYLDLSVKKIPLYVINKGTEQIVLNIVKDEVSPITIIKPAEILSIQVLKDKSATDLYQEKGKYGVVLITIKDENLDEVIKKLTEQGYIL